MIGTMGGNDEKVFSRKNNNDRRKLTSTFNFLAFIEYTFFGII